MNNINLLIVASSDMFGFDDEYNLPNDVLNITYPCNKYNGKLLKEQEITNFDSPRCSKCHYTEVEHKYGYPLYPLHATRTLVETTYDKLIKKVIENQFINVQHIVTYG